MPQDLTPDADELATTLPKTGPDDGVPPVPKRPAAPPRAYESLHDDDPAHTADNAGDATQAS